MDNYYILVSSVRFDEATKKFTYNQFLTYAQTHGSTQAYKVLKTDYNALNKRFKGVNLRDKNGRILNELKQAGKAERV